MIDTLRSLPQLRNLLTSQPLDPIILTYPPQTPSEPLLKPTSQPIEQRLAVAMSSNHLHLDRALLPGSFHREATSCNDFHRLALAVPRILRPVADVELDFGEAHGLAFEKQRCFQARLESRFLAGEAFHFVAVEELECCGLIEERESFMS